MTAPETETVVRTLRLKVKPEAYNWLDVAAVEVNQVWNFCNETSMLAATRTDNKRRWLSGFDLCKLTAGASSLYEKINADVIQSICVHYAQKRIKAKKLKLRWRVSFGSRRSLGWVPFKAASLKRKGRHLRFAGKTFRIFERDALDNARWKSGQFAQDSVGDWWLCLSVDKAIERGIAPRESVGIDLGLKSTATTSDGDVLPAGRFYRDAEQKIGQAQRRGHKRQAKRVHRKAKRQRADALHKFSRKIVDQYQHIVIGDVSSTNLVKTRMAKSVLDSGWGMLKTQLSYKGQQAGRSVEVVNERYTSKACSNCGSLSGPTGLDMLSVREWSCGECGVHHDRDINAAKNILALRCGRPLAGTSQIRRHGHRTKPEA